MARPKGSRNKITDSARHVIFEVFDQIGGAQNMAVWAKENQTEFYRLWGKSIPQNIKAEVDGTITVEIVRFGANPATS
jgi:hypothetical protein